MSLFNDTTPANTEAIKLGASRIREVKTALNTLLSPIFSAATPTFQPGWVTHPMIADGAVYGSLIPPATITHDMIADGAIYGSLIPPEAIETSMLSTSLLVPVNSVDTAALQDGLLTADTAGRAKMVDGFVTRAKMISGVPQMVLGSYAGNGTTVTVSGLAFAPAFVYIVDHAGGVGYVGFLAEVAGGVCPFHITSEANFRSNGLFWTSDGFRVDYVTNLTPNVLNHTYYYLALAV